MAVNIGKSYKIESDELNVTLFKRLVSKKSQNTYWVPIAYFSNVVNALKHLVDMKVNEIGLKDFRTVVKKQEELYRLIASTHSENL